MIDIPIKDGWFIRFEDPNRPHYTISIMHEHNGKHPNHLSIGWYCIGCSKKVNQELIDSFIEKIIFFGKLSNIDYISTVENLKLFPRFSNGGKR